MVFLLTATVSAHMINDQLLFCILKMQLLFLHDFLIVYILRKHLKSPVISTRVYKLICHSVKLFGQILRLYLVYFNVPKIIAEQSLLRLQNFNN